MTLRSHIKPLTLAIQGGGARLSLDCEDEPFPGRVQDLLGLLERHVVGRQVVDPEHDVAFLQGDVTFSD